ncbi:hypothetical protein OGAPHI_000175 [Ogataea philodendri]|uniref:Uncharacterized protein n=1 Tax=Ogataea philodendri TaxID=1378263 RepID=A0A9P8PFS4_9ASCO|nr:uncharacterized protein OGAPHI_000175 [Ogataea philodendri]KAH3671473.1 hypothetical protein OGAPHI_000175 [Ogataea philodendri]
MSDWSSTLMKRPDLMGEWMAAMILAALCSGEMQIAMSLALTASFPAKALPTVSRAFSVATMPGCTETTLMCGNSSLSFLAMKLRAALEAPYAPDGNGRWLWMDPPIVDTKYTWGLEDRSRRCCSCWNTIIGPTVLVTKWSSHMSLAVAATGSNVLAIPALRIRTSSGASGSWEVRFSMEDWSSTSRRTVFTLGARASSSSSGVERR